MTIFSSPFVTLWTFLLWCPKKRHQRRRRARCGEEMVRKIFILTVGESLSEPLLSSFPFFFYWSPKRTVMHRFAIKNCLMVRNALWVVHFTLKEPIWFLNILQGDSDWSESKLLQESQWNNNSRYLLETTLYSETSGTSWLGRFLITVCLLDSRKHNHSRGALKFLSTK